MLRTQIQLTEEQVRRLRTLAREQGVSLAEVIRRCVDRVLAEEQPERGDLYHRAARLVGRFQDKAGAKDMADEHDLYLAESYE